jgi:hypothetical protein
LRLAADCPNLASRGTQAVSADWTIERLTFCQLLCSDRRHGHSRFARIGTGIVHGVGWSRRLCARQAYSELALVGATPVIAGGDADRATTNIRIGCSARLPTGICTAPCERRWAVKIHAAGANINSDETTGTFRTRVTHVAKPGPQKQALLARFRRYERSNMGSS